MAEEITPRKDFVGVALGLLVFASGIGLLLLTFKLAYDLFSVPQSKALGLDKTKAIDLAVAGESLAGLVVRVLLLFVMAAVGSMIANRGIKLYVDSRVPREKA